jgi:hypothetical protein
MFNQAQSRGIRARVQSPIRHWTGRKTRAAVLDCLEAGATALGLFWSDTNV